MPTLNQLLKNPRITKKKKNRVAALQGSPFKKGVCIRVYRMKPKKPNSAQRKVARVKLCNNRKIAVFIPGEGHALQEHSVVLVRGGRVPDLPGVKFHAVRSKYDFTAVTNRKSSPSKYGVKTAKTK
jgi:small subunit ribosomal protein S12